MRWIAELEVVLRACVCLKELCLYNGLSRVPQNVIQYPAVTNLRVLELYCKFAPSSTLSQSSEAAESLLLDPGKPNMSLNTGEPMLRLDL